MIRTLLVDDEPLALSGLRTLVEREADVEVVGEAVDGESAQRAIDELKPELIFLDVQMPGMSGLDLALGLDPASMPVVVFVTAHDRYAVQAFEACALDYILKPLTPARFQAAMVRARQQLALTGTRERHRQLTELLDNFLGNRSTAGPTRSLGPLLESFVVRSGTRITTIDAKSVDWIEAAGNYVELHARQETHQVRISMGELETRLDPSRFVRIHRSTLVNRAAIREVHAGAKGTVSILLQGGTSLPVGKRYRHHVVG